MPAATVTVCSVSALPLPPASGTLSLSAYPLPTTVPDYSALSAAVHPCGVQPGIQAFRPYLPSPWHAWSGVYGHLQGPPAYGGSDPFPAMALGAALFYGSIRLWPYRGIRFLRPCFVFACGSSDAALSYRGIRVRRLYPEFDGGSSDDSFSRGIRLPLCSASVIRPLHASCSCRINCLWRLCFGSSHLASDTSCQSYRAFAVCIHWFISGFCIAEIPAPLGFHNWHRLLVNLFLY